MRGSSKSGLSRRTFLSTTTKSAVAAVAYTTFKTRAGDVFAATIEQQINGGANGGFQPAFTRLDEYIARHMADIGAPGMMLALANRDGALRISTYGFADTKSG